MKKRLLFFSFCFIFNFLFSQHVYKDYKDGQVYVKLAPSLLKSIQNDNPNRISLSSLLPLKKIFSTYGVTAIQRPFYTASDNNFLSAVIKLKFTQLQLVSELIDALSEVKGVEFAEKVPYLVTDIVPNDPTLPAQLNQINAPNAWNVFNGNSNITVAIVDNAVMWTHSDLVTNTYTNSAEIPSNSTDDDGNGYVDDVNGYDVADLDNNAVPSNTLMDHGTHCAGIAGASTNNGSGIAAIGWNIKIIPVKCSYNGSGTGVVDAGYEGIIYAAKAKARVISCSWGGAGASVIEQTVIDYAWSKGCIIIASAGNANTNVQNYPGAYNHVYCVSSVDSGDLKSGFSNYGTWVDIAAPGENIYSTIPSVSSGTFGFKSGTSMATPLVAGLAGLMLSQCSWMSSTDVLNCISNTAVNIYTLGSNGTYSVGNQLGVGRIEAYQAMNCATAYLTVPPIANFFAFPLNTCPNTPVQFYDSSLYAPTNYTWTFQGGTPLTSNSASPSAQWSTPGTYSVSLKVSNANGNNTKTKLSYITVAGAQPLPFVEGFESLPFLPLNWTAKNVNYDNVYWQRHTGNGGFGTSTVCAKFDNYTYVTFGDRDEMRSPKFNMSNVALVRLRYDVAYARYNAINSDTLEVKLSNNCGSSWLPVSIKGGTTLATAPDAASLFVPTSLQWRRDTFDVSLNAAGQGNVMFAFINHGQYGQPIYLDNINLFFPTPTLNINPLPTVCVNSTVSLVNTSSVAASYTWSFPGGSPATSTQTNPSVSYASPGIYTLTLAGTNGTSTTSITRTVNVSAYPVLSSNSSTICSGSSTNFSLTGASFYTVNPGNLSGTLVSVSPAVTTIYTVTGSNGFCVSTITTAAYVNANPTVSVNSASICPGQSVTLIATGASTYSWSTGSTSSSLVVSPATSSNYIVTGSSVNCTATQTANVFVYPAFTLSANSNSTSICSQVATTLSALGANAYTWSTGSFSASTVVAPNLTTIYTVTGSVGSCIKTSTVIITVIATPGLSISASPSASFCAGGSTTLSVAGAYNNFLWSAPSATGSAISVTPNVSTVYTVSASGNINGCTTTSVIPITVYALPVSVLSVSNSMCSQPCSGSINAQSSGGLTPYSYSLSAGSCTTLPCNNLCAGTYQLYTGDAHGCSSTQSCVIVANSGTIQSVATVSNSSCGTCPDGAIQLIVNGGTGPYSYTWTPSGGNSNLAGGLVPGCYTVHIADANACPSQTQACVSFNSGLSSLDTPFNELLIYPNPANEFLTIEFKGQCFNCYLYNSLGQLILRQDNTENQTTLLLGAVAKGIYFIEIISGGESIRKKLLIE